MITGISRPHLVYQSEASNQSIDQSEASIQSVDQSEASIHLVYTGGVDDGRQGDLAGGVNQEGVGQEDGVEELVNMRPPGVHLGPDAVSGLDVDDHPFHGPNQ